MTGPSLRRGPLRLLIALLAAAWLSVAAQAQTAAEGRGSLDFVASVARQGAVAVSITTPPRASSGEAGASGSSGEPWARTRRLEQDRGLASGFILSSDGEILTNAHAVAEVDQATVRLADGRQFVAKVVGLDKLTDVALLKIEARGLAAASLGDSEHLNSGEWVLAIGAPFGLDGSVSAGIVSAPRRLLPGSAVPLIQTDVAINPGSSGGPLLNRRGEVIGINSMVFSLTGGYMGVSFAVPIDLAIRIADELRASGRVSRGQLGAKIQALTPELARSFGLPAPVGALVLRVAPASPAARSGLRSGDVVLGIDGSTGASYVQLQQDVAAARPGQRLVLNVWRQGSLQRVEASVTEAPPDLPVRRERATGPHDERLGLNLGEMSAARRDSLGLAGGLPVLESHGPAAQGGVQSDDVLVAVGDRSVCSIAEFDAALAAVPGGRPVALLVLRAGTLAYVAVEPGR